MGLIDIPDVIIELLERRVYRSDEHNTVESLVESILTEYLKRHDRVGRLHVPFSTMLMNAADSILSAVEIIDTIDWYDTHEPVKTALDHMREAEILLRSTAKQLASKGK